MFILRSVCQNDISDLFQLSQLVLFINLPPDQKIIQAKLLSSIKSFKNPSASLAQNYYIFVLENADTGNVIGVSMIHAQHGTEDEPHFFLRVSQEHKFSQTINTGFIHGTLKLGLDTDGPSEIGGLVLHPDYRKNNLKLGKQLSFVRFLYMALNKERFRKIVLSELMPPLDSKGNSPLWEAIGRRFMNMGYHEADELSRSNKEFILSLFPSENIYQTLLPIEARNAIGKVGPDTLPVKKMLEGIGFKYSNEVDPFDGGPHFKSRLDEIKPIKQLIQAKLEATDSTFNPAKAQDVLLKINYKDHDFAAIKTLAQIEGKGKSITAKLPEEVIKKFKLKIGENLDMIYLNFEN